MKPDLPFVAPTGWRFGVHLATVVSVVDDAGIGRVQVRLHGADPDGEALVMARVAAAFAGPDAGAFFMPDVGDEVVLAFVGGDHRHPVVIGSLWNGMQRPPDQLPGDRVDRWVIAGRAGTRISLVEESGGGETVLIETPAGVFVSLTDSGGGEVMIDAIGHSATFAPSGIAIRSPASVTVEAPEVTVKAASVTVNAAMATFSGVVKCQSLVATSVQSAVYSPGAGNIW